MSSSQLVIKQCYDSEGLLRANDVPCDPFAEVSTCCGTDGSVCVDNLHCINPAGGSVPGTCTFSSWVSGTEPACPCPPVRVENQTLDYRDGVTLCPDGGFCCGPSNFECCNSGDSQPIILYGNEDNLIPATSSLDPTSALSTYYADLAVSTQSISRATTSPTASTSASVTESAPASITSDASTSTDTPSSSSGGLSTGASAGIGAGISVVVIISIFLISFVFRRRRRRRMAELDAVPSSNMHYNQQQPLPPLQPPVVYEKGTTSERVDRPLMEPSELDSSYVSSEGSQYQPYREQMSAPGQKGPFSRV